MGGGSGCSKKLAILVVGGTMGCPEEVIAGSVAAESLANSNQERYGGSSRVGGALLSMLALPVLSYLW